MLLYTTRKTYVMILLLQYYFVQNAYLCVFTPLCYPYKALTIATKYYNVLPHETLSPYTNE